MKQQQALDREDRVAWRNLRMAELQEDKKRAEELQAEKERRTDKIRMAQIEADKELALKELKLKAQQDQASTSLAAQPCSGSTPSYKGCQVNKATMILNRREA